MPHFLKFVCDFEIHVQQIGILSKSVFWLTKFVKVDEALTWTKCSKWERRKELLVSPQRGRYASPVGNRKMQSLSEIVRNGLREIVGNSLWKIERNSLPEIVQALHIKMLSLDPKVFRKSHTEDDLNFEGKPHEKHAPFFASTKCFNLYCNHRTFFCVQRKERTKWPELEWKISFSCKVFRSSTSFVYYFFLCYFFNFFPFFQGYCSLLSMFADGKQRGTLFSFVQTSNIREISKSVEVQ